MWPPSGEVLPMRNSTAGGVGRAWRVVATALVALCLVALPAVAEEPAQPPQDYTTIQGLSQPQHEVRRDSGRAVMSDGVEIAVDVVRPIDDGPWPAILVVSPYHGTLQERTGPGFLGPDADGKPIDLDSFFAPRGYAVVFADVRGTGRSAGCLQLLGEDERRDAYELVEWVAAQPWANGKVGMAGHSYPGSSAVAAASGAPPHLTTIVASAAAGNMYPHQFQQGVAYHDLVLGPLAVYQAQATAGFVTEPASQRPVDAGCEWLSSTALHTDHVSGVETAWHRERDFRDAAAEAAVPVFASYGTTDGAVNLQSLDWFTARQGRPGDKLWIGQWNHGTAGAAGESYPYPTNREEQWRTAVHAWFDHHLQGRDIDTGPPVEVFLNDGQVLVADAWPLHNTSTLTLYPQADDILAHEVGPDEVASFTAQPSPHVICEGDGCVPPINDLRFESPPASEAQVLLGTPTLHLRAALATQRVNLVAVLFDVAPDGSVRRLHPRGFAMNPELRHGLSVVTPVVPGEVMALELSGVGVAHRLLPGHRLRLEVTTAGTISDAGIQFSPLFGHGSRVDVHLGGADATRLELPLVAEPSLWDDPR